MWTACDVWPQRKGELCLSVTIMIMVVSKHDPEFFSIAPIRRNLKSGLSVLGSRKHRSTIRKVWRIRQKKLSNFHVVILEPAALWEMPHILRKRIWEYHIGEVLANALVKTTSLTPNQGPTTCQDLSGPLWMSSYPQMITVPTATWLQLQETPQARTGQQSLIASSPNPDVLNKMAAINSKVAGAARKTTTIPFHLFSPPAPQKVKHQRRDKHSTGGLQIYLNSLSPSAAGHRSHKNPFIMLWLSLMPNNESSPAERLWPWLQQTADIPFIVCLQAVNFSQCKHEYLSQNPAKHSKGKPRQE